MSDMQMDRRISGDGIASTTVPIIYHGLVAVLTIFSVLGVAAARLSGRGEASGSIWREALANARASAGYAFKY